jgi:predicted DNA-binding WGR domain protein
MPSKRKIDEVVESELNLEKLSSSEATTTTCYLVCNEGTSNKFYEVSRNQDKVMIRYGRIGTDGVSSNKEFGGDIIAAEKFVTKTIHEKTKKGYSEVFNDNNATMPSNQAAVNGTSASMSSELVSSGPIISSGNLADDLENGQKVFIKGSSAMPYTLKKFDGIYIYIFIYIYDCYIYLILYITIKVDTLALVLDGQ